MHDKCSTGVGKYRETVDFDSICHEILQGGPEGASTSTFADENRQDRHQKHSAAFLEYLRWRLNNFFHILSEFL